MNFTICPKCGKDTERLFDGLCQKCFFDSSDLAQLPLVLHVKICSSCGARFRKGRWTNDHNIDDIVIQTVEDELLIHEKADNIELYIEPRQMTPHLYRVKIDVDASVMDEKLHQQVETEVRITRLACDMCSRMSGGYFESILQIRATNRRLTDEEKGECMDIVNSTLARMHKKGDRMAFISNSIDDRDGIDLYMGSANASRDICKETVAKLGGGFSESPSLFTRKDGKDVYRITFSLRLPEFMPGDIIEFGGRVIEVRKFGKNVTGMDLISGSRYLSKPDDIHGAELVARREDAIMTVVVATEEDELMLLDPETFKTVTIKKPLLFNAEAGDEVPAIKTNNGIVVVPEDTSGKNSN
ncbi:60S ribosomal export protein NMD3 [Methanolobus halotolerans]|uniref:NMD protein affecting ribosome stability and mRNA decay n=1 Tax=Methanolobus halotolerans TaxID=2052935 RepID=A0A4E0PXI6_9EURY|nr:60S ribosomal export protein NMD3 [Methanolobus halotolerans]TGC07919.1 NMD protein affecting ribosome stability and mRNA decay [Methanolobus halotolerans]